MQVLNGLLGVVLGILGAVLGVVLGILAAVVWLVGLVLCVTLPSDSAWDTSHEARRPPFHPCPRGSDAYRVR